MDMDEQLETLEETGQTEAEQIDEQTEIQDVEDDMDELLGEDAEESDQFHAFDSFVTDNEADYDGFDEGYAEEEADLDESAAMPMVSTMPATPESVRLNRPKAESAARMPRYRTAMTSTAAAVMRPRPL